MNDLNFRSLENLQVPDSLTERLLRIPETEEQKPPVIPWYRNRAVIAAASLVLISVLSITVYFLFGNKTDSPVPIAPSHTPTVTRETVAMTEKATDPTEPQSVIGEILDSVFRPSELHTIPFAAEQQTDPNPTANTNPTVQSPTEKPIISPTEPPIIIMPTEAPTKPAMECPTEEEPPEPLEPTEPPIPSSTLEILLPQSLVPENGLIYCKMIDENGTVLGDGGIFANKRLAEVLPSFSPWYALISYRVTDYIELSQPITVRYYLYDSGGNVFYSDTAYVGNET